MEDAEGTAFVLEGGAREDLCTNVSKKLLSQFASGFPKSWARSVNAERKRLRQILDLKVKEERGKKREKKRNNFPVSRR